MRIHQVEDAFGRKKLIKMWEPEGHPFEEAAVQQIENVAKMPFIHKHVAVMPDAHYGMGATVGTVIATKGAIMAFSKSLARSLAPTVRVNCVAPGWIKTKWGEKAPEHWQQIAKGQSLSGRWGTPEDVARAVRFLASPAAGFITGCVLPVNGGLRQT